MLSAVLRIQALANELNVKSKLLQGSKSKSCLAWPILKAVQSAS